MDQRSFREDDRELPQVPLKEPEWNSIQEEFSLLDDARLEIEHAIAVYTFNKELFKLPPKQSRNRYRRIARLAQGLHSELDILRDTGLAPLTGTLVHKTAAGHRGPELFFSSLQQSLTNLVADAIEAASKLSPSKRGPRTAVLKHFILTLHRILKRYRDEDKAKKKGDEETKEKERRKHANATTTRHRGLTIAQGSRFALAICKVAHPDLGEECILKAARRALNNPEARIKAELDFSEFVDRIRDFLQLSAGT